MILRRARPTDAPAIAAIYAPYVADGAVSFEMEAPDADEIRARIHACQDTYPWLVAEENAGAIAGYAYASQFRARRAYRFTVETTVYVAEGHHGRGVGGWLYDALIETLAAQGFTQAIAAITLPNEASRRLHEARGFVDAGVYRDVGYKLGAWRSVGLWQRALAPMRDAPAETLSVTGIWRDQRR